MTYIPTIIYHRADYDGIFCREIAKQYFDKLGQRATYIGWDYGDPVPVIPPGTPLYMLDISVDGLMDFPGLIWIDHHKSAMEKFHSKTYGYRIDGVAACRLAWQWFFTYNNSRNPMADTFAELPTKQEYIDRTVTEPLAVRLAGEYDIWDKRDPRAELFQHGLRSQCLDDVWGLLLDTGEKYDPEDAMETHPSVFIQRLLDQGECLQYAKAHENESIITAYGFTVKWEGLCFLVCNHARFNSHLFTAGIKQEHDALMGFNFTGEKWRVSLYHKPGREDLDLSTIAVKYKGGGHRGACGFQLKELPFMPLP